MRQLIAVIVLSLVPQICLNVDIKAADTIQIDYVGSTLWKSPNDVAIEGNYAYCALNYGLVILDVNVADSPLFVSQIELVESRIVEVAGGYAYIIDGEESLHIVDVSNPTSPQILGSFSYGGCPLHAVALQDNYAYLAADSCGLIVLDISNPANPSVDTTFDTTGLATDIAINSNHIFTVFNGFGMVIIDRLTFSVVSVFDSVTWYDGVALSGSYACLFSTGFLSGALGIVDIANPSNPVLKDTMTIMSGGMPTHICALEALGTNAYVAHGAHLMVIGFSDPTNLDSLGTYITNIYTNTRMSIQGDYAYLAANWHGLEIVDVSNPLNLSRAGVYYPMGGSLEKVVVDGNYAYVSNDNMKYLQTALWVVDITNPNSPTVVARLDSLCSIHEMVLIDSSLYVAEGSCGLVIVDIKNPLAPETVGSYSNGELAVSLTVAGNYAYVAFNYYSLVIIDISTPSQPQMRGEFRIGDNEDIEDITIAGSYVYMVRSGVLTVLDVSNPDSIDLVGYYDEWYYDVIASNNYLFAGKGDSLDVLEIAGHPTSPSLVASCELLSGGQKHMAVDGHFIFTSQGNHGMGVVDISEPTSPTLVGSYKTARSAYGVDAEGWTAYLVEESGAFSVLIMTLYDDVPTDEGLRVPETYSLRQNYPNPFNPSTKMEYSLPTRAHVTIEVYNILGQKIKTLVDELKPAGNYTAHWEGKDFRGRPVATGIYLYRIQAGDFVQSKKMLLLK